MILSLPEIENLIKSNPGRKRLSDAREYMKKLRMHIYGDKLDEQISAIDGFEKISVRTLRAKYSKSNKDLFARLARPIDKVFTAKGGSIYYNLSPEQEKKAIGLTQNVIGNFSVRQWIEQFWKPHMLDDPFGLIMMEILPADKAVKAKTQGKSFVYPTYKPTDSIHDYLVIGNNVEWVIFEVSRSEKIDYRLEENKTYYRIIDDAKDYLVRWDNETVYIIDELTFDNYFMQVPAMLNSDIHNPAQENYVLSLYDEIVELADSFLLKGSIKSVHDFLHGFPKYSEFADDCNECSGSGMVHAEKCKACSGTGKRPIQKVSDVKLLTWPAKDETVILPNQVGGYISPDKTFYEIATADLSALENMMHHTLWGSKSNIKTSELNQTNEGPKTATEIVDDLKPQADRLAVVSEMAERRHKFIVDAIIKLQVNPNYKGASVNYGRRYLLESPDAIWEKYKNARSAGAPQNVLDTLLNEFYEANYQSDPIGLEVSKKLMYVEPFVHYTISQLSTLRPSEEDYKAKLYYSEWLSGISEAALIINDAEALKKLLYEFVSGKTLKEEKSPIAA